MPRYAQTTTKAARLSSEFGLTYATRLFGEEAVASIPTFQRGANTGKPKGFIKWMRTTTPGYHPNMGTGVGVGVTVRAWIAEFEGSGEESAMIGKWMGRKQNLCGSASVLGPEARERDKAEKARREAEWAEEKAEMLAEAAARGQGPEYGQ